MKRHFSVIIFTLNLLLVLCCQSQSIRWFQEQSDLPTTFVRDIEQDKNGNILLATYLGLIVYDGNNFVTKSIKHGLPTTSVSGLVKDAEGNIWMASLSDKLSIYYGDTILPLESYNSYMLNKTGYNIYPLSAHELIVDYVMPFFSVRHVFVNGKWQKIISEDSTEYRIPLRDPLDKTIICGYFDYRKLRSDKNVHFNFLKGVDYEPVEKVENPVISKLSVKGHEYLSVDKVLYEFNANGICRKQLFQDVIVRITNGINNTLWLGFEKGGILHVDQNTFTPLGDVFLKDYNLYNFLEDADGGKWFSCSGGLGYQPAEKFRTYTLEKNLSSSINTGIAVSDTIFLGHSNGDIGYFIPGKQEKECVIFKHPVATSAYQDNFVSDFLDTPDGNIIAANSSSGIYAVEKSSLKVRKISAYSVNRLYAYNNKIYCALYENGVLIIDKNGQQLIDVSKIYGKRLSVECVFVNSKGVLHLGCETGLFRYEKGNVFPASNRRELRDRIVLFKQLTATQSAIFTCGSGLVLCSEKDTLVLDKESGIVSNCIAGFCKGDSGCVWLCGVEGVSKLQINRHDIRDFEVSTIYGAQIGDYVSFSVVCTAGKIYLLGKRRITVIDVLNGANSKTKIPFRIVSSQLNGKSLSTDSIQFQYSSSSRLSIHVKQINYLADTRVSYYYRLVGYQEEWTRTYDEEISLLKLPPGSYTFEAYATIGKNEVKTNLVSLPVRVAPLWRQRTWFKILAGGIAVFCTGFVIFILLRGRIRKVRKENELRLKLAHIENKLLRSNMNPHFVFNSLNSIQSFIAREEKESAIFYLGKFSKLMRHVLEQSAEETVSLRHELDMITSYIELERIRCNNSFDFVINENNNVSAEIIKIPGMLLQPYVENAIVHGLGALTERKGQLTISVERIIDDTLICVINDNGIGRAEAGRIKQQKEIYHRSMGLSITNERLDYFRSSGKYDTRISVADLYNDTGAAMGTRVEIRIPVMNKT